MNIDSIQNGFVIDHIPAGRGMILYDLLGLDSLDCSIALIKNVNSRKMGKKDIIKIDAAIEINNNIVKANSVYVSMKPDYEERRKFQTLALSHTYSMLSMIDIAYRTFGIETDRVKYWTSLVVEVQGLLRNWRKSDADRYKNLT